PEGWRDFWYEQGEAPSILWGVRGSPDLKARIHRNLHELGALLDALNEWAGRWHLAEPWCIQVALDTLAAWHAYPDDRKQLSFSLPLDHPIWRRGEAERFVFNTGWLTDALTEEEFRRANVEWFEQLLDRYIARIKQREAQEGRLPAP